jgi:hypothetical protein
LELGIGINRGAGKPDRCCKPPPHGSNQPQGNKQKRQWRTKGNRFSPPREDRRLAGRRPSAKGCLCQGLPKEFCPRVLPSVARLRSIRPNLCGILPRCDKVVTLLDKIRNNRHGIRRASQASLPHWGPN